MSEQLEPEAFIFDEKINSIKNQFFAALDDFKKYYVYFNKNPEVNEFQNYYVNSKGQLQTMSRELFLTTNDIDTKIEMLSTRIRAAAAKLTDEKKLNKELLQLLSNLQNTKSGSEILIDDSKEIYNKNYYYNCELVLGISIISFLLVKIFRSKSDMKQLSYTN